MQSRMAAIEKLKRKYGVTVADIYSFGQAKQTTNAWTNRKAIWQSLKPSWRKKPKPYDVRLLSYWICAIRPMPGSARS